MGVVLRPQVSQIKVLFAKEEGRDARQVKALAVHTLYRNRKVTISLYTLQNTLSNALSVLASALHITTNDTFRNGAANVAPPLACMSQILQNVYVNDLEELLSLRQIG